MIYQERTNRSAHFISPDGEYTEMHRVPFMEQEFNEAWLQQIIADHPNILPASEFGAQYDQLVLVAREVPVGSGDTQGYIDNLYATPSGQLVIVETKLFRNQESRRTVVAQIIDYAKELQKWTAEDLDNAAREYYYRERGQAFRLIDLMAEKGFLKFSDEARLTDALNDNLTTASFLLMIVGDGIRSNVAALADFLNENAALAFNLALVELEIYPTDKGCIVIPNAITKTTIVERRPFRSSLPSLQSAARTPYVTKPVLSRREFVRVFSERREYDPDLLDEFLSDVTRVDGISINITPTELQIDCVPDGKTRVTLLYVSISGENDASIYIRPDRLIGKLAQSGCFPSDASDYLDLFKGYIDPARCKAAPYDFGADRFYYAFPDRVLQNSTAFVGAFERLMAKLSA